MLCPLVSLILSLSKFMVELEPGKVLHDRRESYGLSGCRTHTFYAPFLGLANAFLFPRGYPGLVPYSLNPRRNSTSKEPLLSEHISEKAHIEARRPKAFFIC
ncbi:hypothetical protein VNO78_22944 [Psophocarpus tetragonolobus]|uniref:Uncharacterized protein n=1 Tax=Psophocarpus tetragonolobus TaxID=3891 RepID=A0AAN9XCK9_PSOTE